MDCWQQNQRPLYTLQPGVILNISVAQLWIRSLTFVVVIFFLLSLTSPRFAIAFFSATSHSSNEQS